MTQETKNVKFKVGDKVIIAYDKVDSAWRVGNIGKIGTIRKTLENGEYSVSGFTPHMFWSEDEMIEAESYETEVGSELLKEVKL